MRWIYALISFAFGTVLFAQNFTISGEVQNEEGAPLPNAIVTLYEGEDIIKFTKSNTEGKFHLKTDKTGYFGLAITHLDFEEYVETIQIESTDIKLDLGVFPMDKRNVELATAVISANPYKTKDTVNLMVDKYRKGFEFSVEDLLKEIPGFEIDKDGQISINKTPVSSVLIEGDDLFSSAYSILTQNMPSEPLETIQIIKNHSKNKSLRGVQQNDEMVLNLLLKEEEKGNWISTIELASTSYIENMQQVKFNLMNFKSDRKLYTLFNYNNLGKEEMAGVSYLFQPKYSSDLETVNELLKNEGNEFNDFRAQSFLRDNRDNFNNDALGALNYIKNFPKNSKLQLMGIFNRTERNRYTDRLYHFNFEDENFSNQEYKHWKRTNLNSVGKIEIEKDFKHSTLNFSNRIFYQDGRNDNQFRLNDETSFQDQKAYFAKTEHQLNYSIKLDSISALSMVGMVVHQNKRAHYFENTDLFTAISGQDWGDLAHQQLSEKMTFLGFKTAYAQNIKEKRYIEIQLGGEWKQNENRSNLSLNDGAQIHVLPDYQNQIELNLTHIYSSQKLSYEFNKRWGMTIELKSQYLKSQLNDFYFDNQESENFYLSPKIQLKYVHFKYGSLNLGYIRNYALLNARNFYRNFVFNGDRNLQNNELHFDALGSHLLSMNYQYEKGKNKIEADLNYMKNDDYLSSNSLIQPDFNQITQILLKNNHYFDSGLSLSRFLNFINSRVGITQRFSNFNYENRVNNSNRIANTQNVYRLEAKFKSGWLSKLNTEAKYRWEKTFHSSDNLKQNYDTHLFGWNVYYTINNKFRIESLFEYQYNGNTAQKALKFFDIKAQYALNEKIQFYTQLNNLFNEKYVETYRIDNVSETFYKQQIIPLHIVLGCRMNLL